MNKLNLGKEVEKAFSEGIYADTPENRKLGRVGMSYKTYSEKEEKEPTPASAGSGDDGGNKKQGKRVSKKYTSSISTKKKIEERKKKDEKEHQKYIDRERTKYVISALTSAYGSDLKDLSEAKVNVVCKYIEDIAKETTGKPYSTNYKKGTLDYKKERIANFYIKSGSINKNASISDSVSAMNDILSDILEGQG